MRLNPRITMSWYFSFLACRLLPRMHAVTDEAAEANLRAGSRRTGCWTATCTFAAASMRELDRLEEARAHAAKVRRTRSWPISPFPQFSRSGASHTPYRNAADRGDFYLDGAARRQGYLNKRPLPLPDKPSIAVLPFNEH